MTLDAAAWLFLFALPGLFLAISAWLLENPLTEPDPITETDDRRYQAHKA